MSSPPPARRTGRILSLGVPLPGPRVDNYNFLSAPSFFDYDAIVVEVRGTVRLIESVIDGSLEPETFAHEHVRTVPRSSDEVALADVLARRRDEIDRTLANGGAVIAFADRPSVMRGEGMGGLASYWWLPAAEGVRYDEHIVPAEGTQAQIVDYQHPLAPFVLSQLANIAYRARIDVDSIPSFASRGAVFARSYGGAAIGVEMPCASRGRIALLPALRTTPSGDQRYAFSDALQAGLRRMLGVMAEGRRPSWVVRHALPGLEGRESAVKDALSERDRAQKALDAAQASLEELARFQALLWQEGALALEPVAVDALKRIGFTVYDANPDEIEIRDGQHSAIVEFDASDGAVGMAAHYRLRQRIERAIERRGAAPRGLLLINGYRLKPPSERPPEASDALRLAAETMRYCIAPTSMLFDAVRAQMSGDTASVDAFRASLMSTDGVLDGDIM